MRSYWSYALIGAICWPTSTAWQFSPVGRRPKPCRQILRETHSDETTQPESISFLQDRRQMLAMSAMVGTGVLLGEPAESLAAVPISLGEAQNVGAQTKRMLRAKPPKILRPRLEKDFAVLLMRSSYNVLDELDCVGMDQFQRDFFIIRQAEYEPYVNQLGPGMVQQGDLTDPYYVSEYCSVKPRERLVQQAVSHVAVALDTV